MTEPESALFEVPNTEPRQPTDIEILRAQSQWQCEAISMMGQQINALVQMLQGVQQAASMMGGPMGKMAQKFMMNGKAGNTDG